MLGIDQVYLTSVYVSATERSFIPLLESRLGHEIVNTARSIDTDINDLEKLKDLAESVAEIGAAPNECPNDRSECPDHHD